MRAGNVSPTSVWPARIVSVTMECTPWRLTELQTGASVGANATIRCGVTLGEWCLIGSGAVVPGIV